MKQTSELPRLTFEEVLSSQIALRQQIRQLIGENRTLKDDELEEFERLYFRATLGKGALVTPRTELPGLCDTTLDNIVIEHLSVPNSRGISASWADTDEKELISPARAWRLVLSRLDTDVFGASLQQAVSLSPEKPGGMVFGGLRGKEKD